MFRIKFTETADATYKTLKAKAEETSAGRKKTKKTKASKVEGLFRQVAKAINFLSQNPRHPGLQTHAYDSIEHPFNPGEKVFEAYVQNATPGAYRVFWCFGPKKGEITILAITPHP